MGESTRPSTSANAATPARADIPTASNATKINPNAKPKPIVNGKNLIAISATITSNRTLRKDFMSRKPGPSRKVARIARLAHTCVPVPNLAPLPVVCAVIENAGGQILIAQRPAHKHLGLKWEFPGGKVEPDESPQGALLREIQEELGCQLEVTGSLPRFIHDYTAVVIEMIPFVCRIAAGSPAPHPHEHVAVRWVDAAELSQIDLAPADFPVVTSYRAATAALDSSRRRN